MSWSTIDTERRSTSSGISCRRTPVEEDFAGPGLIDTGHQAGQGRFAGTAGPDHRYPLARPDNQVEVLDQGRPGPVVTERDPAQFHLAGQLQPPIESGNRLHFPVPAREARVFRRFRDVLQPIHVGIERLALVRKLHETPDRRQKHCRQYVKPYQRAQCDFAGHDLIRPDDQDRRATDDREQARQGRVEIAQFGISLPRIEFTGLLAAPAREKAVVRRGHPQIVRVIQHQHADAEQHSLFAPQRVAPVDPEAHDNADQHRIQRGQTQNDERERHVVGQHGGEEYRAHGDVDQERKKAVRQTVRNSVYGHDAGRQIADQPVTEEFDGQAEKLRDAAVARDDGNPDSEALQEPLLQQGKAVDEYGSAGQHRRHKVSPGFPAFPPRDPRRR